MNGIRMLVFLSLLLLGLPIYAGDDFGELPTVEEYRWDGLSNAQTISETNAFIEKQGSINDAKTIFGSLMKSSSERDYSCAKAFGHIGYCQCLGSELPANLSFDGYVAIVTGQDTTGYFQGMKPAVVHTYYKKVIEVRDSCVAKLRNNDLRITMPFNGRSR